ncbi:MAG: STAS domain-containing protein [Actinomycetota bacterium]|nr:STAS domain-containing protein [Actinomycetota bacterium]
MSAVKPPQLVVISVQRDRGNARITLEGDIDPTAISHLQVRLQELLDSGVHEFVVDLAAVAHCDFRLFDVLAQLGRRLRERQAWMHVVGPQPQVFTALDSLTLPEVFKVYRATLEILAAQP